MISTNFIHSAYGLTWSMLLYLLSQKIHPYKYNTFGCLLWNIFRMLHKLLLTNFYYAKLLATFSFKLQIILEEHISFCTEICNWYQTFKLFAYNGLFGLCYAAYRTIQLTTVLDRIRILYNPFLFSRLYIILCYFCHWIIYIMWCIFIEFYIQMTMLNIKLIVVIK